MQIKVERLLGGVKVGETIHTAREAGLYGLYRAGIPYLPDNAIVLASLPYALRKAFMRDSSWWIRDSQSWCARCELFSLRGKYLGVLIATLVY